MHPPNQRLGKPDKLSQGAQSQTSYPRLQWGNTLDKRDTAEPQGARQERAEEKERKKERRNSQEIMGNIGSQSRNILGYTCATGS